jgi:hypothetical protein
LPPACPAALSRCASATPSNAERASGRSSLTFVDGAGLLVRAPTAGNSLMDLAGRKIGVIMGTGNKRAGGTTTRGASPRASRPGACATARVALPPAGPD